jgi:hypothetical protein
MNLLHKKIKVMSETKSFYETYRERVKEGALKLPKAPTEVGQNILWLKSMAIERIEEIDKLLDDKINTFRVHNRKEITLSEAMKLDKSEGGYKFGFTEQYVNLLMHYAYEAGKNSREDDFKRATERMNKALEAITEIVDEAGYIEYPESY